MSAELEHIWSRLQAELAGIVEESAYRIWLARLQPRELQGTRLLVEAPAGTRAWVHDRFGRLLSACAARAGVELELIEGGMTGVTAARREVDRPATANRSRGLSRSRPSSGPVADYATQGERRGESRPGPLANPKLTFEQFVIGDSNRLAHAAALAVAEMPAQAYNPLFICGPPGVGKTHLLASIAKLLVSHTPDLTVRCTTGEAFTNEFIESLAVGRTESFKARFRHVDVLLLDDVQFLERKTKTEEELFHTFNALHDGGRQIVLSSDRPPSDLQALEDRLRERFAAGLVADIRPPDLPTRLTILRKRALHDGVELEDEQALHAIAERVDSNVRALEGALIRVVAFSSLTGRPLSGELAQEVLDTLYPRPAPSFSSSAGGSPIAEIQAAAGARFGVSVEELLSSKRGAQVTLARQVAMYLARELTGQSLPAVARQFGGRDHTTVLHACRRVSARISEDASLRGVVEELCKGLSPAHDPVTSTTSDRVA